MGDLIGMGSLEHKNFGALHSQFWRARTVTAASPPSVMCVTILSLQKFSPLVCLIIDMRHSSTAVERCCLIARKAPRCRLSVLQSFRPMSLIVASASSETRRRCGRRRSSVQSTRPLGDVRLKSDNVVI